MNQSPDMYASGPASSAVALPTSVLVREVRGSLFRLVEPRFVVVMIISLSFHLGLIWYLNLVHLPEKKAVELEKVPERFAKLIIEKPLPKTVIAKKAEKSVTTAAQAEKASKAAEKAEVSETKSGQTGAQKFSEAQRSQARKAVAARAARVDQMVRSVGVLGMLTGVGATAKGPSVVDVLGAMGSRRESSTNLDDALSKMTGLRKAGDVEVLNKKLVTTKEVTIQRKEEIDELVASIGSARSVDLAKKGEFVIQKPESIEGAASSNAKRDNTAINAVVASKKASIRMTYEKYLKRDPALAGKVTIRFTIAASGAVTSVTIVENTTGNADLEQEIVRKVRMWQFETIPEGDVTVTYPFVFMPASGSG